MKKEATQMLLVFMTWFHALAASSRKEFNELRQKEFQEDKLKALHQYSPLSTKNYGTTDEDHLRTKFLAQLIDLSSNFKKDNLSNMTNSNINSILPILKDFIYEISKESKNSELLQETKKSQLKNFRDEEKEILQEGLQPSTEQNELDPEFFPLSEPYLNVKSGKERQDKIKLLQGSKNWASKNPTIVEPSTNVNTKVLKSPVETDVRTGTKFYDSRPNVTDLLINIRNITKEKLGRNQTPTIKTTTPVLPLELLDVALKEQDLYYGPTAIYGHTDINSEQCLNEQKVVMKRKVNRTSTNQQENLERKDEMSSNDNTQTDLKNGGQKINRGIKDQKHNSKGVESSRSSPDEPDIFAVALPENTERNSPKQEHTEKCREWQSNESFHNKSHNNSISQKLSQQKHIKLNDKEISELTAKIVAGIAMEIEKKFHGNQDRFCKNGTNLGVDTNKIHEAGNEKFLNLGTLKNSNKKVGSDLISNRSLKDGLKKAEGQSKTLETMKLPLVTTGLTVKEAGIPLYKIPNTEIYIYELGSKREPADPKDLKITDQHKLMRQLDQLITNNLKLGENFGHIVNELRDSSQNTEKKNNDLISYENIFNKNTLPDFFDSLIFSKPEANSREDSTSKFPKQSKMLPFLDQNIPQIEIHIKNMPLSQKNVTKEMNLLHKKPAQSQHDPFSNILNSNRHQKNPILTMKPLDQHKLLSGNNQLQAKENNYPRP